MNIFLKYKQDISPHNICGGEIEMANDRNNRHLNRNQDVNNREEYAAEADFNSHGESVFRLCNHGTMV